MQEEKREGSVDILVKFCHVKLNFYVAHKLSYAKLRYFRLGLVERDK